MKRALAALAATLAGLAALLGYKSGPTHKTALALGTQSALPGASAAPSATAPPAPAVVPGNGNGNGDDNGGGGAVDANGNPIAPATPPSTAAAAPTPAPAGSTVLTGPDVPNRYGDVQVQLTVQGTKILDVKAIQLPYDRQRSAEISQIAGPMLRSEVIQAQSANIDIISGATYTSESYAQSVQAALDAARK